MLRAVVLGLVAAVVVPSAGVALPAGPTAGEAPAAVTSAPARVPKPVRYEAPVGPPLRVVRPFQAPTSPYGPGHRGVDLATRTGQTVRAAADGVVRFAGRVAGRGVVVLTHADGLSTEYEPVHALVHVGDPLARGQPLGTIDGSHGNCAPGGCLHWGAKRGEVYVDPMSLLEPLGPVRLLPWSPAEDP